MSSMTFEEYYGNCKATVKQFVDWRKELVMSRVVRFVTNFKVPPRLLIIQVGDEFASNKYVSGKIKDCEEVGIDCQLAKFENSVSESELISYINRYESEYDGILVQLPLPKHIRVSEVVNVIPYRADVDGFKAGSSFVPCTPLGIYNFLMKLFVEDPRLDGKNVVIIGRSDIVGKPMAKLLVERTDATVTVCNSHTKNLSDYTLNADIIISAVGKANIIKGYMIPKNATLIDVGINRSEDNKLCGDIDTSTVYNQINFVTPVPGGVGLMTRVSLLENVCEAAENRVR